jgi:ketosteroid isomerase-like protein
VSQEQNLALAERALEAFTKRDMEPFVACFHPGAEFMLPRNSLEGGSYRGFDGIRRAWADLYETWEDIRFQHRESRATGDHVVILGRTTNVGKGTAPTVGYDAAYVLTIEQGSIIRWQPYQSSAEALKAVGLEE